MRVFMLYFGDYSECRVIAVSTEREPLDRWIVQYEALTPKYAQENAYVADAVAGEIPNPENFKPKWATETDEEHDAREAAEYAANPGAYFSTGSAGFVADPVIY